MTLHKIATGLVTDSERLSEKSGRRRWIAAAYELLSSRHATLTALSDDVGAEAYANVCKDLLGYLKFAQGLAFVPPGNLLKRTSALVKKTAKNNEEAQKRWLEDWIGSLFDRGARQGHRWANSLNVPPSWSELDKASDGSNHPLSHLRDQEDLFSKLWEEDKTEGEWSIHYQQVRRWALEQRERGKEDLKDIIDLVNPAAIKKALNSFKTSTSTGFDFVQISKLKKAPDTVMCSLAELLSNIVVNLIGPDDSTVKLHMIAKKLAGFRTIGTFTMLWRVLMACLSVQLKQWDNMVALTGDTSAKGGLPQLQITTNEVIASVAISKGQHHAVVLWDVASFYECVKPQVIAKLIVAENMPPTPATLSLWGHASPRVFSLKGYFTTSAVIPKRI